MDALIALIQRAQAGDREALGAIVQRFQDMAVGYAYAILGDFHLAEGALMSAQTYVEYECTHQTFRSLTRYPVRWLEWETDYSLVQLFWPEQTPQGWREARQEGFEYCALIEHAQIQAMAAVWRYSEAAWEVASVYTRPEARGRGYAKAVVAFVTAAILEAGKRATCSTASDNWAMQRVAESVGFQRVT